jgi:beta-galactosidase/beta-glucuronidase
MNDEKVTKSKICPTPWTSLVNPDTPWNEYPRPQFVRPDWLNLNGPWQYAIRPNNLPVNQINLTHMKENGSILVPFCIESYLSGVQQQIGVQSKLWYKKQFQIPPTWKKKENFRYLLHFGAVDWSTEVYLNYKLVGKHQGGYTPFSFEITEQLLMDKENILHVIVWDPTDKGMQEKGKQTSHPGGIFYTPTTGIWQTVWIEPVPSAFIESWKYSCTVISDQNATVEMRFKYNFPESNNSDYITKYQIGLQIYDPEDPERFFATSNQDKKKFLVDKKIPLDNKMIVIIPNPQLWSPEQPNLYPVNITLWFNGKIIDTVGTYFGLRTIQLSQDITPKILFNNNPQFQLGPLDQGYWPDGIYTPPTEAAMIFDIEKTKEMGFNMIRKHIKVEMDRWYYHCDRLGILVWQDMPCGGHIHMFMQWIKWVLFRQPFSGRNKESKKQYFIELASMIETLYNHPSIVMWVPFNEGWGQFDTKKAVTFTRALDNTRLINCPSGFFDQGYGDICDRHVYLILPKFPKPLKNRSAAIGEMGGYGLLIPDHQWPYSKAFKYGKMLTMDEYKQKYLSLIKRIQELQDKGLVAAVYTQTTDVEAEINGLMTYDRVVMKLSIEEIREMNLKLFRN